MNWDQMTKRVLKSGVNVECWDIEENDPEWSVYINGPDGRSLWIVMNAPFEERGSIVESIRSTNFVRAVQLTDLNLRLSLSWVKGDMSP